MHYIIIAGPNGKRKVEEGKPFRLESGETVVGSEKNFEQSTLDKEIQEYAFSQGLQYGDVIKKLTGAFGIKPCSKCEQRRRVLNAVSKEGWVKTLKKLKDIGV